MEASSGFDEEELLLQAAATAASSSKTGLVSTLLSYTLWLMKWSSFSALAITVAALAALYSYQNAIIYPANFPEGSRKSVPSPKEFGMSNFQDVDLKTSDGVNLKAYFIKQTPLAKVTLLYLHANAGNMGHRLPIAKYMMERLGCNVLMLSYRGYGLSEGEPSEKGLVLDAQAALDYIVNHDKLSGGKVIVYGQSIGGAVSIAITAKNQGKIDALIIENTFTSMSSTIQAVLGPYLGVVRYFCHQKWMSEETISKIDSIPILFLSGMKDELIPPAHMKKLFKAASKNSKQLNQFVEFANGTHNDTCIQSGYFEAVVLFWKKAQMGRGRTLGS